MSGSRSKSATGGIGLRLLQIHYVLLIACFVLVALTGTIWAVGWDLLDNDPGTLLYRLTQLHGAGGFLALLAIGSLLPQHVRFGWKSQRNRWSGCVTLAFAAILVISGYALYYGSLDLRPWAKWIHLILGLLAVVVVPLHVWLGRRSRSRRARHARSITTRSHAMADACNEQADHPKSTAPG